MMDLQIIEQTLIAHELKPYLYKYFKSLTQAIKVTYEKYKEDIHNTTLKSIAEFDYLNCKNLKELFAFIYQLEVTSCPPLQEDADSHSRRAENLLNTIKICARILISTHPNLMNSSWFFREIISHLTLIEADQQQKNDQGAILLKPQKLPPLRANMTDGYRASLLNADTPLIFNSSITITEDQGRRAAMEDAFFIALVKNSTSKGQMLEQLCTQNKALNNFTCDNSSGSTAAICHYDLALNCIVYSNLGDSRIMLLLYDQANNKVTVKRLTKDHKPTDPLEHCLTIYGGGYVSNRGRINDRLSCGRSYGDAHLGEALSRYADFGVIDLNDSEYTNQEVTILICCDGFFEKIKIGETKEPGLNEIKIAKLYQVWKLQAALYSPPIPFSQFLTKGTLSYSQDNLSIMEINLTQLQQSLCAAIFDGHGGKTCARNLANYLTTMRLDDIVILNDAMQYINSDNWQQQYACFSHKTISASWTGGLSTQRATMPQSVTPTKQLLII
ncbi:PP2C family serine/threonine-protein phosphatase [Rickettsiales endosymbiont of Stachyamoeba lipophora]|uniref:hypothetical protein n=1 Tax=Rickettsiales endosymbiont of Stachyamoeba lipophora TaxID=2486578 RepID=UPI000F65137A|nr:hypothetical protein [Rickettsiales endosymbiont of Stachyamoeba lipophora]AZL15827.1 hypothetical protein EF513_04615 [Rickettsiales endosymbiont of Stachyamoeba lipophora]